MGNKHPLYRYAQISIKVVSFPVFKWHRTNPICSCSRLQPASLELHDMMSWAVYLYYPMIILPCEQSGFMDIFLCHTCCSLTTTLSSLWKTLIWPDAYMVALAVYCTWLYPSTTSNTISSMVLLHAIQIHSTFHIVFLWIKISVNTRYVSIWQEINTFKQCYFSRACVVQGDSKCTDQDR
jgi:hypothetical protein